MAARFVILYHQLPAAAQRASHWDLMLEWGPALRTWALTGPPDAGQCDAEPLADHRLAYLDYEGPVSRNRGTVARYDTGTYTLDVATDEHLALRLAGARLTGRATLTRVAADQWRWRLED